MAFPSSLPSYVGYIASETLSAANNASQLNQMQADTVAIATKLGTGSSTPTGGAALVGNGVGTSTWGQVSLATGVSGILPINQGGTGQGASTGTGELVLQNSPTINSPTENNGIYTNSTITTPNITYSNNTIPAQALVNNSITGSQIATGGISASNLAATAITLGTFSTTSQVGTSSTSYAELAGTTLGVTIPGGGREIEIDLIFYNIYSTVVYFMAIYRGTTTGALTTLVQDFTIAAGQSTLNLIVVDTPSSGTNYYTLAAKTSNGSDAVNVQAGAGNSITMIVKAV